MLHITYHNIQYIILSYIYHKYNTLHIFLQLTSLQICKEKKREKIFLPAELINYKSCLASRYQR